MKINSSVACVIGSLLSVLAMSAARAQPVTLQYESAPTLSGPWQSVDPARVIVQPNGSASLDRAESQIYFRVRISASNDVGTLPLLRLQDAPAPAIDRARRHLQDIATTLLDETESSTRDREDASNWADAELTPFAYSLDGPGPRRGTPSILELKVVRPRAATPTRETFLRDLSSDPSEQEDRGYMLVSLDRDDLPVLQFATEGPTPTERLLRRTRGQTPARIVRYGPTFYAAEDAAGNLIANIGTEPFKIPHDFVASMNERATGIIDTETGVFERPTGRGLALTPYTSYQEFKEDMERSPVHQLYRERRAQHARLLWDIEEGAIPPILELGLGQTNVFLEGVSLSDLVIHWEDNDRNLADVEELRTGGFRAAGRQEGSAPVTYRTAQGVARAALVVTSRARASAGLHFGNIKKSVKQFTVGNGWADQMYYYQLKDDDWCDLVGCGPTALAMLFGWWDRKGVPSAFYTSVGDASSFLGVDAPQHIQSAAAKSRLRKVYGPLHDYCDVICFPFSDAGATPPGDLIEGFYSYTLFPSISGHLGVSSSWAYDSWGDDWNTSGSRVANGIKNGRPGVIGLGVLWHYGVAYSYKRIDYSVNNVVILRQRYFKVNEGWPSFSPSWYSAYDVFLGLSTQLWQKKTTAEP